MEIAGQFGAQTVTAAHETRHTRLKWRMLFVTMLCYASYYTGRQNFGFAAKYLAVDLHLSAAQIGTISAGLLVTYGLGNLLGGYLGDHVSPRCVVTIGAILSFALNWATSFGHNYWQILLPWVLNGLAQAMGWSPSTKIVANWWPQSQRGLSFGLLLFGMSWATVLTYAACLLSLSAGGWREVFRLPVLSMIPAVLVFYLWIKDQPSDAGLPNIRVTASGSIKPLSMAQTYLPLVRNRRFLLICASIGCESMARYGLLVWIPIHLLGSDWLRTLSGNG